MRKFFWLPTAIALVRAERSVTFEDHKNSGTSIIHITDNEFGCSLGLFLPASKHSLSSENWTHELQNEVVRMINPCVGKDSIDQGEILSNAPAVHYQRMSDFIECSVKFVTKTGRKIKRTFAQYMHLKWATKHQIGKIPWEYPAAFCRGLLQKANEFYGILRTKGIGAPPDIV